MTNTNNVERLIKNKRERGRKRGRERAERERVPSTIFKDKPIRHDPGKENRKSPYKRVESSDSVVYCGPAKLRYMKGGRIRAGEYRERDRGRDTFGQTKEDQNVFALLAGIPFYVPFVSLLCIHYR